MPDKTVQLPDGRVVSFPDSMADADIAAVIKKDLAKNPVTLDFSKAQPILDFSKAQPIDTPQSLLSDPGFQKLSPEAQHIVLSKKFPDYANLSPEAQKIVLSKAAPQTRFAPPGETGRIVMPVAGGVGIPMDLGDPEAAKSFQRENANLGPLAAGGVAGELSAGLPLLARMATAATAAGGTAAATGSEHPVITGAVQGAAPELGGAGIEALSSVATKALARILRLSPKAFQFGKEPAKEVLEQGISGMSLPKLVENIGIASKQTTAQLNDVLQAAKGTVNAESAAIDVANSMPGNVGNRFLKVVDDAIEKLGLRSNQLSNLNPADANALKQEIARQSKFVEGDMRAGVANAGKVFGGKLKDEIIKVAPDAEDLLQTSANLTEASKGGDYALRMEKAGRGPVAGFQLNKPLTMVRPATDTTAGVKILFKVSNMLKDVIGTSNALRIAFNLAFGSDHDEAQ
jgi:hypothetical protein